MEDRTKTMLSIVAAVGTAVIATYLVAKGGLKETPVSVDLPDENSGWDDNDCETCDVREKCGIFDAQTPDNDEDDEETENASADTRPVSEKLQDYIDNPPPHEEKVFNPDPIGKMTQSAPTTKKSWFDK